MSSTQHSDWQESVIFGFIWAVVGVVYSVILVAMLAFFRQSEFSDIAVGLAAASAGAVGALFYGSLRLAVLAAIAALIAAFGYLSVYPMQSISAQAMFLVSGLAGLIVGGYYGQNSKGSRVQRATAKSLAGLYAGFVAGMPVTAISALSDDMNMMLLAGALTPLTGVVYIFSVRRVINLLHDQPPPLLSGALVGGSVAGSMGIAVWAFAGILNSTVTGNATEAVRFAWSVLPQAALGGMIGGFFAGTVLAAISMTRLQESEDETQAPPAHFPPRGV